MLFEFNHIVAAARSMLLARPDADDRDIKIAVMIALQQKFPRPLSGTLNDAEQIPFPNFNDPEVKQVNF